MSDVTGVSVTCALTTNGTSEALPLRVGSKTDGVVDRLPRGTASATPWPRNSTNGLWSAGGVSGGCPAHCENPARLLQNDDTHHCAIDCMLLLLVQYCTSTTHASLSLGLQPAVGLLRIPSGLCLERVRVRLHAP
jgi:hypothetical protein